MVKLFSHLTWMLVRMVAQLGIISFLWFLLSSLMIFKNFFVYDMLICLGSFYVMRLGNCVDCDFSLFFVC